MRTLVYLESITIGYEWDGVIDVPQDRPPKEAAFPYTWYCVPYDVETVPDTSPGSFRRRPGIVFSRR
jgi:hypothetical protein